MKKEFNNEYETQIIGIGELSTDEMVELDSEIQRFEEKLKRRYSNFLLKIDIKKDQGKVNNAKFRHLHIYSLIMNLVTNKGKFHAKKEGWGIRRAVIESMEAIDRQAIEKEHKTHQIHGAENLALA